MSEAEKYLLSCTCGEITTAAPSPAVGQTIHRFHGDPCYYEPIDWTAEDEAAERFAAIHQKQEERWQRVGQWYEEYFALKFMDDNLPKPQDALLGSRLRVQISIPHGDWVDYRRDGKYPK